MIEMNGSPRSTRVRAVRAAALAHALSIALVTSQSYAQSPADRATARSLAEQGYAALEAKQFDVAEDRFHRADQLVHAPTLVLDHGRALMGLGRYVEAQERFELVVREGTDEDAPDSWKQAVFDAAALVEQVKPKIAWLTVIVPGLENPRVTVDGELIPRAALGVRRATNPGSRTIQVTAEGYVARTMTVELGEGANRAVQIVLGKQRTPTKNEPVAAAAVPTQQAPPAGADEPTRDATLSYVALGVGGVGLAVGSVTGFLVLGKRSDLDLVCEDGVCPRSAESDLNTYNTLGIVSGVSLAVGLAGAVTGVVTLLTQTDSAPANPESSARLRLDLGPGRVGLHGVF